MDLTSQASFIPFAHGGDLAAAEARFGRPDAGWLDLSTGINPFSYPLPTLRPDDWTRLPADDAALRQAAACAYGVSSPACILPTPGSEAGIRLLARENRVARVRILGPTYSTHADAWRRVGAEVIETTDFESLVDADAAVVVHPNNPDGRLVEPKELLRLADAMASRSGFLAVDEAFADLYPEASVAGAVGRPGLFVLRSFGKFFGLAGLRLGFLLAEPDRIADMKASQGAWAISGPAQAVGAQALEDKAWHHAMRGRLADEAKALDAVLAQAGLVPSGGAALFRYLRDPRAHMIFETLARQGILVRPFAHTKDALRIGLPPSAEARKRLADALRAL